MTRVPCEVSRSMVVSKVSLRKLVSVRVFHILSPLYGRAVSRWAVLPVWKISAFEGVEGSVIQVLVPNVYLYPGFMI